jgi:DNA-binding CsgD family transcriptional regulator/transcriptional regulator with GAF, ATPase, and Fis domain
MHFFVNQPSKVDNHQMTEVFDGIIPHSPLEETLYHWVNLLCDVSDQVTAPADLREVVQKMLEVTCELLGAERSVVLLKDPRRPVTITHEYRTSFEIPSILGMTLTSSPLLETILHAKRPVVLTDFERAGVRSLDVLTQGKIKSTVLCKLSFRGSSFGILSIQDCSGGRAWSAEDVALTRLIGTTFSFYLYALHLGNTMSNVTASFLEDLKLLSEANSWRQQAFDQVVKDFQAQTVPLNDDCLIPHFPQLTKRERQILLRLDQKNKQIGREFMLSEATIKSHVGRILAKLGKSSRVEAFALVRIILDDDLVTR